MSRPHSQSPKAQAGEAKDLSERLQEALLARPRVSLRLQLIIGFLAVFVLAVGIAAAIIVSIYRVEERVNFLEIVNDYVFDIEEARRFEKNIFLYGTNLEDALDSVDRAKGLIEESRINVIQVVGEKQWQGIYDNLVVYEGLLNELRSLAQADGKPLGDEITLDIGSADEDGELGVQVRKQGQTMTAYALDLMEKEKKTLHAAISGSRKLQTYSLVFLLVFMITTAFLMSGNIVRSIERYESYAERIASGDFTPITPARRYRDEFTNLAIAINHMMEEIQKHEAMLIQAHKMRAIGTLTAGVAHELNNPLNNITITAHMLLEDFETLKDNERIDMIGDVVGEVDRAKKIVSNLLDFTRESETNLEPVDLVELLETTLNLAANQIRIAGIKSDLNVINDLPQILGDKQQLTQVFLNLVLNAVAASPKGSKIQLLIHPADQPGNLSVKVIDHGTGIPKHILSRVFDPFFTTKEPGKGTGLGLSVSQGIVAKHGGRISVDSHEGKGSTFSVVLPVLTT
ncbi:ATP-binding protein [Myxococcota bacterium]